MQLVAGQLGYAISCRFSYTVLSTNDEISPKYLGDTGMIIAVRIRCR